MTKRGLTVVGSLIGVLGVVGVWWAAVMFGLAAFGGFTLIGMAAFTLAVALPATCTISLCRGWSALERGDPRPALLWMRGPLISLGLIAAFHTGLALAFS